jgi:hypothetical protein
MIAIGFRQPLRFTLRERQFWPVSRTASVSLPAGGRGTSLAFRSSVGDDLDHVGVQSLEKTEASFTLPNCVECLHLPLPTHESLIPLLHKLQEDVNGRQPSRLHGITCSLGRSATRIHLSKRKRVSIHFIMQLSISLRASIGRSGPVNLAFDRNSGFNLENDPTPKEQRRTIHMLPCQV